MQYLIKTKHLIDVNGDSLGDMIEAVAEFVRKQGYPAMRYNYIKFLFSDGSQSDGWMISKVENEAQTRVFDAGVARGGLKGYGETENGIPFRSYGSEAFMKIDNHYYYISK